VVSNTSGLSLDVRDEKPRSSIPGPIGDAVDADGPIAKRSSVSSRCRKRTPHARGRHGEHSGSGSISRGHLADYDSNARNFMKTCFAVGGKGSSSAPNLSAAKVFKDRLGKPGAGSYLTLLRRWPQTRGLQAQPLSHEAAEAPQNPWQGCFDDLHLEEPSFTLSQDGSPTAVGQLLGGPVFVSQQWSTSSRGDTARSKDPLRRDMFSRAGSDTSDWAFNSRSFNSSRFSTTGSTRCGTGLPSNRGPGSQISSASRVATPSVKQGAPLLPPLTASEMLSINKQYGGKGQSTLSENFALMDLSRGKQCRLVDLGPDLLTPQWMQSAP